MVISCMDFSFIGGSMGSVVGEKIARAIDYAIKNGLPFVCITKSVEPHDGGWVLADANGQDQRQAEPSCQGGTALHLHFDGPYDRRRDRFLCHARRPPLPSPMRSLVLRDPGGQRDHRKGLAMPDFRRAEFLLEHGFVDRIVHGSKLQEELSALVSMLMD